MLNPVPRIVQLLNPQLNKQVEFTQYTKETNEDQYLTSGMNEIVRVLTSLD